MNDLTVTVTGWVATEPKIHVGPSGGRMCAFRVASTPRRFDRNAGAWIDGDTEWFSVRVFRGGAMTAHESIKKGQPVLVTGRLRTHSWEAADGPRTDLQLDATALGHDLTRGMASFTRAIGDATLGSEADGNGPSAGSHSRDDDAADGADGAEPAQDDDAALDASDPWESDPAEPVEPELADAR
ncbi:single-stranded DNA-binding protein [Demequina zhanjiangensis]|uniref:Single-stranded DNA-binding protein n=1 Tax=Demequina zhanjiangensis TaxID=3051659 RepID=A0ABT8G1L1_9MICO|nr:single-stranded DNA-binding protein [Demequina sp. SYSU T00b26]MDN4472962.1 single-stranded DNA-binding protein [Demequina sp. SYSU T00b26]